MRKSIIGIIILIAVSVWAISGDLNLDGKVDFEDFFLFADQFGKEGAPDTLRITIHDTVRVTVFDTLELKTVYDTVAVYDTVSVEFVPPPETISPESITSPDLFIATRDGEPLHHIKIEDGQILTYYRTPIDSDDDPGFFVDYSQIIIPISVTMRYVPIHIDDELNTVPVDTVFVHRYIIVKERYSSYFVNLDYRNTADLRFPDVADTRGDMVIDVVYRTPLQGDFAARAIDPVSVSSNGKINW